MIIEPETPLDGVKVCLIPSKALTGQTPEQMQICISYMEGGSRQLMFVPLGTLMFTRQFMKILFKDKAHYVVVDDRIVPHFFFSKEEALRFSLHYTSGSSGNLNNFKVETLSDYVDTMVTTDQS